MTQIADGNQSQARDFRTSTASTKVTEAELNELEQAAASCGVRLGEWIREVLLREAKSSLNAMPVDPLLSEVVALQLFLTNALSFVVVRGERMSAEAYEELMRQVKSNKHRAAREVIAQYAGEKQKERHG